MSEYRLGSPVKGVIGVIVSVFLLIYIPKIVLNVLEDPMWLGTFLANFGVDFDARRIADVLSDIDTTGIQELLQRMIVSAIPLVILAFPHKYYEEGNKGRMYVDLIRSVYCIGRYLYILNFGDLAGIIAIDMGQQVLSIDVMLLGVLALAVLLKVIRMPKIVAVYKDEREDYVDFHIVDGQWVNISRKEYKELRKEKRKVEKLERKDEKAERKDRVREANGKPRKKPRGKDDNGEDDDR